jgi:flavodoxin
MNALVVYESIYGNTRAVAEAVAEGLGDAAAVSVHEVGDRAELAELLVVGGPTHVHGMTTARSREMAVHAAEEDGHTTIEPSATEGPGLRKWLKDRPERAGRAAAFDTRLDRSPWMTGMAARGIAKRLRRRGYDVLATESFLVADSEGPLEDGELERARAWGAELAAVASSGDRQSLQTGS